jgi:hypothetical protein
VQVAYLEAARLYGSRGCAAGTLQVSMLYEGLSANDIRAEYANPAARALANITGVAGNRVMWVVVPASAPAPVQAQAAGQARGLLQAASQSALALFAVETGSAAATAAAQQVVVEAAADGGAQLFAAMAAQGVPVSSAKPSVAVAGRLVLAGTAAAMAPSGGAVVGAGAPAGVGGAISGKYAGIRRASGKAAALDPAVTIGVAVGVSVGGAFLIALLCGSCCVWHKRRQARWLRQGQPSQARRITDSAVFVPGDAEIIAPKASVKAKATLHDE